MQNIPCNVIRDLLVLYEDDACSEESRQMIEEHIAQCEACRDIYEKTRSALPVITLDAVSVKEGESEDSARKEQWEMLSGAFRKLERMITYRHLITLGLVLLVLCVGAFLWIQVFRERVNRVPSKDVQVTELYELENGDIYCTFRAKEVFTRVESGEIQVPDGKRFEDYDEGWQEVYFQYPFPWENPTNKLVYGNEVHMVFPKGNRMEENAGRQRTHIRSAIYFVGKNEEDRMVVWEEGQKIEPAPAEVEEKIEKHWEGDEYEEYEGGGLYALSWIHTLCNLG